MRGTIQGLGAVVILNILRSKTLISGRAWMIARYAHDKHNLGFGHAPDVRMITNAMHKIACLGSANATAMQATSHPALIMKCNHHEMAPIICITAMAAEHAAHTLPAGLQHSSPA